MFASGALSVLNQNVIEPKKGMSHPNCHTHKSRRLRTASVKWAQLIWAAGSRLRTKRSRLTNAPTSACKPALPGALAA